MNVRLLGPLPTPGVAYLTKSFRNQCGVVISASHNNYQDNGIKIFDNSGVKIDRKIEMMIENILTEKITSLPSVQIGKAKSLMNPDQDMLNFVNQRFLTRLVLVT